MGKKKEKLKLTSFLKEAIEIGYLNENLYFFKRLKKMNPNWFKSG